VNDAAGRQPEPGREARLARRTPADGGARAGELGTGRAVNGAADATPGASDSFAAFTMASVVRVVMSTICAVNCMRARG
jgi:hypothetical protein